MCQFYPECLTNDDSSCFMSMKGQTADYLVTSSNLSPELTSGVGNPHSFSNNSGFVAESHSSAVSQKEEATRFLERPGITLQTLTAMLRLKGEQIENVDDLHDAIKFSEWSVHNTAFDHLDLAGRLAGLSIFLWKRFQRISTIEDRDRAIEVADMVVNVAPFDHPNRANFLTFLGSCLNQRFQQIGTTEDLSRALELLEMAVDISSFSDHSDRPDSLTELGDSLGLLFEQTGDLIHLDRAVELAQNAVNISSPDHPNRASYLNSLGTWLAIRSSQTGLMDINLAVDVARMAVEKTPRNHPDQLMFSCNLQQRLCTRFERTQVLEDINLAIKIGDQALHDTPLDHPTRFLQMQCHGDCLGTRFRRTGFMEDINRAIDFANMAVDATPSSDPVRVNMLYNLGRWLGDRFERTGSIEDLTRSIEVTEIVIAATPLNHPRRSDQLNSLGVCLRRRFKRIGEVEDINRAIQLANAAVNATPFNHIFRVDNLQNLGSFLCARFERTGDIEDLNRAIEIGEQTLHEISLDNPARTTLMNGLGHWLGRRFRRTGAIEDIDRAIHVATMAVNIIPLDHPHRAGHLNNLATWLSNRFDRNGEIRDIDQSIDVLDEAIEATPRDHPDRIGRLNNLSNHLGRRFKRTKVTDDINRAIHISNTVVDATPLDDPRKAHRLFNLGNRFDMRFEQIGELKDLDRAIELTNMAVELTASDHPDRAGSLLCLGDQFSSRFRRSKALEDFNRSLSAFRAGWKCDNAPPSVRIDIACSAAFLLISQSNWDESSAFLQDAVMLLPLVSPRSLQRGDKQHMLARFSGLASTAAAVTLCATENAYHSLKFLELGRGVIAGLLLETRTDISALEQHDSILAQEFVSLRDDLDPPSHDMNAFESDDDAPSRESYAKRRREVEQKFKEVVARIRNLGGEFENFLLPPTEADFKELAKPGPIVAFNSTTIRSDAIIVTSTEITAIRLRGLDHDELRTNLGIISRTGSPAQRDLVRKHKPKSAEAEIADVLLWLWNVAVQPVLTALDLYPKPPGTNPPGRVWWMAGGLMSLAPVHAAGDHRAGSSDNTHSHVISSYTSTFNALRHARRQSRPASASSRGRILIVAMPDTPGHMSLNVRPEVDAIVDVFGDSVVNMHHPSKSEVLHRLRECDLAHFACHGKCDVDQPSEGGLLLAGGGLLRIADMDDDGSLNLAHAELAYLSACSTAEIGADALLVDEAIHLANSFQLIGFRNVVGTMWGADDGAAAEIAKGFYEALRAGWRDAADRPPVALALHRAVTAFRSRGNNAQAVLKWAPFVHLGV